MLRNSLLLLAFTWLLASSCQRELLSTDPTDKLAFSLDTLLFDTVFTTIGSTTLQLKVYNPNERAVEIERVKLGNPNGYFRLNVDGIAANEVRNLTIRAKDSIFVFVEVTVDPRQANAPMLVHDSIEFFTNGNLQDVHLVAFGQDMHLLREAIACDIRLPADKPYLVYGYLLVDSACTLELAPGTQMHFYRDAGLYVAGRLLAEGTLEQPVVFEGSRLEYVYSDVPGQWRGLVFLEGSQGNVMRHAIVKNATVGIQLGALLPGPSPDLLLENCRIEHHSAHDIYSLGASFTARNTVLGDCGQNALRMLRGGYCFLNHCTIGNHWAYGSRQQPSLLFNNFIEVTGITPEGDTVEYELPGDLNARLTNSIVHGTRANELGFSFDPRGGDFDFSFENCLIRADQEELDEIEEIRVRLDDPERFAECLINPPGFRFKNPNSYSYDYRLDTLSPAKDAGRRAFALGLPRDFFGNSRLDDLGPDMGAFERIE